MLTPLKLSLPPGPHVTEFVLLPCSFHAIVKEHHSLPNKPTGLCPAMVGAQHKLWGRCHPLKATANPPCPTPYFLPAQTPGRRVGSIEMLNCYGSSAQAGVAHAIVFHFQTLSSKQGLGGVNTDADLSLVSNNWKFGHNFPRYPRGVHKGQFPPSRTNTSSANTTLSLPNIKQLSS